MMRPLCFGLTSAVAPGTIGAAAALAGGRGVGAAGKSSTIDAMAGKQFDAQHQSTVGVGCEDLELLREDLSLIHI